MENWDDPAPEEFNISNFARSSPNLIKHVEESRRKGREEISGNFPTRLQTLVREGNERSESASARARDIINARLYYFYLVLTATCKFLRL